jgi:alpha-glucosidase
MSYTFVDVRSFTPNSHMNWIPIGNIASVSRSSAGNVFTLSLADGNRTLQLSFLSNTCFRVRFNPAPQADYKVETSFAVVNRNLGTVNLNIVQNTPEALVVDTGAMQVNVDLQPYRIRVFRRGQLISADEPEYNLVYIPGQMVIANFKTRPDQSFYYGIGEKAGNLLNKHPFTMTQFNYDNFKYVGQVVPQGTEAGPLNPSDPLYASIPIVIEVNPNPTGAFAGPPYCCGLFFDNPAQTYFNIGANDYSNMDGKYYFGALYGDLDYYFFLGNQVVDVLGQYTTLTGRSPMPPKYIFGFHQGCYGYFDSDRLEGVANAYRNANIPIDGLHIDVDFQNNYRTFTHSEKKFRNAAQMMKYLHDQGFKCSTNITPLLTDSPLDENNQFTPYDQRLALLQMRPTSGLIYDTHAGQAPSRNLYEGRVNYGYNNGFNPYIPVGPLGAPGNYPDLGRADVRATWGQQYAHLINDLGMDMIWQDMTCPALDQRGDTPFKTFPLDLMINNNGPYVPEAIAHNAYVLFLLDGTWNGLKALRPNVRNFIIARGGYAGMQRYAALWTGDSATSWDFLAINIPEVLNLGLSGVPISGCDIGGFASDTGMVGRVCGFELLTRWMHLGSFLPWYRNHYDGYNKDFQEPYRYGEQVPTNCRKYVELRYRTLQIYYDAMYEWTQTGMPIARALFLNDPDDPQVYNHLNDQFFVGRDVLVAPIVTQQWTRQVYLPAGSQWYAFKDNLAPLDAPVPGGVPAFNYFAPLDLVPIYIRAGAILPMRELEQYVGQRHENPLTINVYPGADSTYPFLYQDDGISCDAQDKKTYRLTEISHQGIPGGQNIRVRRVVDNYTPPEKYYFVALPGTRHPSSVTVAGAALLDLRTPDNLAASTSNAYYWNEDIEVTFIKVFDTVADLTIIALFQS